MGVFYLIIFFNSSIFNQGFFLWIILWQLAHTKARSSNLVFLMPEYSLTPWIWWHSMKFSPRSPYFFLNSKLHASQTSFPFFLNSFVFFFSTIFLFLSRYRWTLVNHFPSSASVVSSSSTKASPKSSFEYFFIEFAIFDVSYL